MCLVGQTRQDKARLSKVWHGRTRHMQKAKERANAKPKAKAKAKTKAKANAEDKGNWQLAIGNG